MEPICFLLQPPILSLLNTSNYKMADAVGSGICCAHNFVDSNGDNEISNCIKCIVYESQLREALYELSSLKLVNKLLQMEVLAYTTHKSTWEIGRASSDRIGDPMEYNG